MKENQKKSEFKKNLISFLKANNPNIESYTDEQCEKLIEESFNLYLSIEKLWSSNKSPLLSFESHYQPIKSYRNMDAFFKTVFMQHYFESDQVSDWSYESLSTFLFDFINDYNKWEEEAQSTHSHCQEFIENIDTLSIGKDDLICSCHQCLAEFRTKIRDMLFKECRAEVDQLQDWLTKELDKQDLSAICNEFSYCKKNIEKKIESCRYQLKRSSINKIKKQMKNILHQEFDVHSEMGQKFCSRVREFCQEILDEESIGKEIVGEHEFKRFFSQMNLDLWKSKKNTRKEFFKMVRSLFLLKRKDISSTIIQDYLGQFWQHSPARKIERHITYHLGPTNSGKTYYAIKALKEVGKGCYLAPLRLLASEQYDNLNSEGVFTTLLTGEEVVEVDKATHTSSTIEMAKINDPIDCCVIDEIQMIHDSQRGWAWTRALVNMIANEIHLCGDASALELVKEIVQLTGDHLEVKEYTRLTKLNVEHSAITLGELEKGDALIVFSRRNALKYKGDLEKLGFKVSIVYGRLSPDVRREQARKFDQGETDIIVSTDAISMGMNLPIKRIVFSTLSKFINSQEKVITDSEIKQIAGRAGRYKRYPTGFVTCLRRVDKGIPTIENAISSEIVQSLKAMVGPDLDIFTKVNDALGARQLKGLDFSEFLRLFNTMEFKYPFYCVELNEMIQVAEMIEEINSEKSTLSSSEIFGFACAPVNLGLLDHVMYFQKIAEKYVNEQPIYAELIDFESDSIDYLETSIKCTELYQWLSRHFNGKNFEFDENVLIENKMKAVQKLNSLLSEKIVRSCSSCGVKLEDSFDFNICESCFKKRRFAPNRFKRKSGSDKGRPQRGGRSKKKSSRSSAQGSSGQSHSKKKRWKRRK